MFESGSDSSITMPLEHYGDGIPNVILFDPYDLGRNLSADFGICYKTFSSDSS